MIFKICAHDIADVNLSEYDEIRLWVKNHSGNGAVALMYLKVFQDVLDFDHRAATAFYNETGNATSHPDEWFEAPKQPLIEAAQNAARAIKRLRQSED